MQQNPFLITYPRELLRLFMTGNIKAPDGKFWSVSFCPGLANAWGVSKMCMSVARDSAKWGWNPYEHWESVRPLWNWTMAFGNDSIKLIKEIPKDINEGFTNISNLWRDIPFGWIPLTIKTGVCDCVVLPIIKLGGGILGIASSLTLSAMTSVGISSGRFILGNGGAIIPLSCSLMILIFVPIISGFATLGASLNRFPNPSDNGKYGLSTIEKLD